MESHDLYKTNYIKAEFDQHDRIDDGIIPDSFFDDFSSDEFALPYNELPEIEWFSNFGNDSFINDDLQNLHLIPQPHTSSSQSQSQSTEEFQVPNRTYSPVYGDNKSIPSKARSKRSRAAPCDWSSRIVPLPSEKTLPKTTPSRDNEDPEKPVRRCTHCGSEKTPQWRSGPMGPKSLCNACGVRHKSGRLVPEYRPAASPTFVSAKHSNSHRKVMELRRQNELRQYSQSYAFSESSGNDYFIHP